MITLQTKDPRRGLTTRRRGKGKRWMSQGGGKSVRAVQAALLLLLGNEQWSKMGNDVMGEKPGRAFDQREKRRM